jgi:hypothetical protein
MSPERRNALKEFLQNVSKEPLKLKWNKASNRFDLPEGVAVVAASAKSGLPRYIDHPAKEPFSGKPAAPDFKSDPDAKRFASRIKEGAAKGPDFAGSYTVVQWGCGSGCQSFVIVDAKSGKVYTPGFSTERGLCFRKDSSLLIADPITDKSMEEVPTRYKTSYYQWDGNKLDLITETSTMVREENCK